MTDFEILQENYNEQVNAYADDPAYYMCFKLFDLKFVKLLLVATQATLKEFAETYYPSKKSPMDKSKDFIKNIKYKQLSERAIVFKNQLRNDFINNYPKPSVKKNYISYETATDFYSAYTCLNLAFEMGDDLEYLSKTPLYKKTGLLFWKKIEIPIFTELDNYTISRLKEKKIVSPLKIAAWHIHNYNIIDFSYGKSRTIGNKILDLISMNPSITLRTLKNNIKANCRKESGDVIETCVRHLYNTIFNEMTIFNSNKNIY